MQFEYLEESGKQYLNYKKKDNEELDTVTIGMVENNVIPGVIPFFYVRNDNDIEFRYDISGLENIKTIFDEKVTKNMLVKFLKSIISVMEGCENYMVDSAQIVLDPESIFSSDHGDTIHYVLLPILRNEEDFNSKLRMIILNLHFDKDEDCSYIAELLDYFQQNDVFSLDKFRSMTESVEKRTAQRVSYRESDRAIRAQSARESTQRVLHQKKTVVQAVKSIQTQEPEKEISVDEEAGEKKKGFLGFGRKDKGNNKVEQKKNKQKKSAFGGIAIPGIEDGGYSKGSIEIPPSNQPIQTQKIDMDSYHAQIEDFGHTQLLRKGETSAVEYIPSVLVRVSTGESYEIVKSITKIGRKKSIVDICILGNLHVGRLHAIIYREADGIYVEDNGSGNGTFINDDRNPIEQKTELHSGDSLFLGDEELLIE